MILAKISTWKNALHHSTLSKNFNCKVLCNSESFWVHEYERRKGDGEARWVCTQ